MDNHNAVNHPKKRRILYWVLLFLTLLWICFTAVSWVLGRQTIERYCTGLAPGATIEQARDQARYEGLSFPTGGAAAAAGEGVVMVTSPDVFGRYVCEVRHNGQAVTGAALRFMD
jgi:hypothetical protein